MCTSAALPLPLPLPLRHCTGMHWVHACTSTVRVHASAEFLTRVSVSLHASCELRSLAGNPRAASRTRTHTHRILLAHSAHSHASRLEHRALSSAPGEAFSQRMKNANLHAVPDTCDATRRDDAAAHKPHADTHHIHVPRTGLRVLNTVYTQRRTSYAAQLLRCSPRVASRCILRCVARHDLTTGSR